MSRFKQSRFAGVRVTDYRADRPLMTSTPFTLHRAIFAHAFQLMFQARDALLHATTIDFQLRFARTARADSTGLPRKVRPHSSQPWE